MDQTLPPAARWLGAAGLLPFLGLAAGVAAGYPWAAPALAAYGATILAFLGAVHWGLALARPSFADLARFGLGVLPSFLAWVALMLPPESSLNLLGAGILGTLAIEHLAAKRRLLPQGYLRLRWVLSLVACICLFGAGLIMGGNR